MELNAAPTADYDGAWKEAMERFLPFLVELCFPAIAAELLWDEELEFLDKELEEVVRDAALGKQRVDKLVKLRRRNGSEQWLLFHVEVASQSYVDLARTMYQYHHRLEDRYGQPVLSVAILADDDPRWRPTYYENELLGCRLRFDFPVCKLLDFKGNWTALEASENLAAAIIMAHLRAMETRRDMNRRFEYRWEITRAVYERGYGRKEVWELLRLIDWLLTLPEELKLEYRNRVLEYEKENDMPHVTVFESVSHQEGLLKGEAKGRREEGQSLVLKQLRRRVGELPAGLLQAVEDLSLPALEDLGEALLDFRQVADLQAWLASEKDLGH